MNRKEIAEMKKQALFGADYKTNSTQDPDFYEIMDSFIYSDTYGVGTLSNRQRVLINICVLLVNKNEGINSMFSK